MDQFCLSSFIYVQIAFFSLLDSKIIYCLPHRSSPLSSNKLIENDFGIGKEILLEGSYHGLIRENESVVEITPVLKVDEEKICSLQILQKASRDIPFEISLNNNIGVIKSTRHLNCETRRSYNFELVALYCDGTYSAPANIHIAVIDVNEYVPEFTQQSYVVEVDEGRLYTEILKVKAFDKDCTSFFGDVCNYAIIGNDQPFSINNEGSIKNTEPLFHKISHNHILSVVAYDCARKESAPVLVNIKVRSLCEPKYHGIPERIDYSKGVPSESLYLFPKLSLELCEPQCFESQLDIKIILKNNHISFACDQDRSECLLFEKPLINLLPPTADWTEHLRSNEGFDLLYHFDGVEGIIVPNQIFGSSSFIGGYNNGIHDFSKNSFSLITTFRHTEQSDNTSTNSKHLKEHIICTADDHKMNRHHMALFIRNCRLIFLLRKNFQEGDLNMFSPAEWRWSIPHVCDGDWHHYVLNIDTETGKVQLYIDGGSFERVFTDNYNNNPEIIDDWPLHAAHGINTTLSIGGCYQSSENRLKHMFKGDISEVKLFLNGNLNKEDIQCSTKCFEHLKVDQTVNFKNKVTANSKMETNPKMNEIHIKSSSKYFLENALRNIQYVNTKSNPAAGRRNVEIETKIICNNGTVVYIPAVDTFIMVAESNKSVRPALRKIIRQNYRSDKYEILTTNVSTMGPQLMMVNREKMNQKIIKEQNNKGNLEAIHNNISFTKNKRKHLEKSNIQISGRSNILVSYPQIKKGVSIFKDIVIKITDKADEESSNKEKSSRPKLDACSIIVFPSLNSDHEEITLSRSSSYLPSIDIKTTINKDGVEIIGNEDFKEYMHVLNSFLYSNKKPAYYLNRVFKLSCSQITSSESNSAEFTLILNVQHPKQDKAEYKSENEPGSEKEIFKVANNIGAPSTYYTDDSISAVTRRQYVIDSKLYAANALLHRNGAEEPKSRIATIYNKDESSKQTEVLSILCVCIFIVAIGLTIFKIKAKSCKLEQSSQEALKNYDEGLIWDDTALNITINPMPADADECSDSDNSESEEEDYMRFPSLNQLEWDNTNIFSK